MPFYRDRIYPLLIDILGDPAPIRDIRRQIIPMAAGTVLELGLGSGANLVHYDPAKVHKLYALEPNPGMIRLARSRQPRTRFDIEYLGLPGERIPLGDRTIDTAVSTFTLCTIPGIAAALQGVARVLKTGGSLIFFELVVSPDPAVRRWQVLLEPIQRRLFQGLYLTRDIPSLIVQNGFDIRHMESASLASFPKSLSYCSWGIAVAG